MRILVFLVIWFSVNIFANVIITQKATINQNFYPNKTFIEIKDILLKKAKHKAIEKIYGEHIESHAYLDDGKMTNEYVNDAFNGVIHLKDEPIFSNGNHFGEIKVSVSVYATDDEIKNIQKNTHISTIVTKSQRVKKSHHGFYGRWSGYVMSTLSGTTKAIVIITSTGQSKLLFPTLHCGSDLLVKSKDVSHVTFKQILNYGTSRCKNRTKVILEKRDENKIDFEQITQEGKQISHGTLYLEE